MMNCPSCGTIMVWLNGSIMHDPPVKNYECRVCHLSVTKYADGDYDVKPIVENGEKQQHATS
ncbi:MAG: hypothetical protein ACRD99_03035 [Nitrososphaera sp.]